MRGPLRSNNLSALLAAARGGMGLAALPWYVAHQSVKAGAVQPALTEWSLPSQEIHAVYPSPRQVPAEGAARARVARAGHTARRVRGELRRTTARCG